MQTPRLFSLVVVASTLALGLSEEAASNASTALQSVNYANQLGFFIAYGLNVTFLQIPNSTFGCATLLSRGYDIITGTIDSAVNFRFNSNASLTVVGQLDQGPELTIAAIPNIADITELRGRSLMVDSPMSGYAYIIRKVLSLFGLSLENGDYSFEAVSSTVIRYADLVAGQLPDGTAVYATLLTYPFSSEAAFVGNASQPNVLVTVKDFIQPLTSSAFTVRDEALTEQDDRALITSFLAAMYSANQFLAKPKHQTCRISAFAAQLSVSTEVATSAYKSATDPVSGVTTSPDFTVNRQGILNIIDVRDQFDGFADAPDGFNFAEAIIPGLGKLIDYSVGDEALNATVQYRDRCSWTT